MTGVLILGLIGLGLWLQYLAVTTWQGVWRWLALAPFAVLGGDAIYIVVGLIIDPTSNNLWPLQMVLVDLACLPFLGLAWVVRLVMKVA